MNKYLVNIILSSDPFDDGRNCRGSGWFGKISSASGDVKMTRLKQIVEALV